jgi:hypothetical protein
MANILFYQGEERKIMDIPVTKAATENDPTIERVFGIANVEVDEKGYVTLYAEAMGDACTYIVLSKDEARQILLAYMRR